MQISLTVQTYACLSSSYFVAVDLHESFKCCNSNEEDPSLQIPIVGEPYRGRLYSVIATIRISCGSGGKSSRQQCQKKVMEQKRRQKL